MRGLCLLPALLPLLACGPTDDGGRPSYDDTGTEDADCPASFWTAPALDTPTAEPTFVSPVETGGGVGNGDGRGHYALAPSGGTLEDELFVYLPGVGQYTDEAMTLLRLGALAGYRGVVLNYPRELSPPEACAATGEAPGECLEQVHAATVYGTGETDAVDIDTADSLQNRLYRLLLHLQTHDPEGAWSDYYADEELLTPKIVLVGSAEGAGHAAYWARDATFARVVLLGGGGDGLYDAAGGYEGLARWVTDPRSTPAADQRALWHTAQADARVVGDALAQWGADDWGGPTDVDAVPAPFACSHQLTTSGPGADGYAGDPRATLTVDGAMALDDEGFPALAPAVLYLLTARAAPE